MFLVHGEALLVRAGFVTLRGDILDWDRGRVECTDGVEAFVVDSGKTNLIRLAPNL